MKFAINLFLFMLEGLVLCIAGFPATTWEYWAIMACTIGISVNAAAW